MRSKPGSTANRPRSLDDEREYIEGLLNTRFNFYLVFASLLLVATFGNNELVPAVKAGLLVAGAIVSGLMAYLVGRSRHLLECLLRKLRKSPGHPYGLAYRYVRKCTCYRLNANAILEWIAWLIAILFALGAALTLFLSEQNL